MKARNRPFKVTIQRRSLTTDQYGDEVEGWADAFSEWAAVYYGAGNEQREAAQEQASQAASFEMLSNANTRSITVVDRVNFDGAAWDIRSVAPIGLNDGVKVNAVRAAGAD